MRILLAIDGSAAAGRARDLVDGLDWPAVGGVAPLKGIGFTVAIFIAALAFEETSQQEEAKLAILAASGVSGAIGLAVLHTRAAILGRAAHGEERSHRTSREG